MNGPSGNITGGLMRESDRLLAIERELVKKRYGGHHKDKSIKETLPELKEGQSPPGGIGALTFAKRK